ncbi:hypothetical protein SporoP37_01475 [Sporosarcina sp. P37]|nr:hypothetical protein SporoP33_01065 [Sporosarcina sp. P33]ARK23494.1 hypothetical protein SporoP37_01475 [Sporosarcina sp. P37]PID17649.1 hypothetical protein CSV62_12230 [Sporosarcina sp. P35]
MAGAIKLVVAGVVLFLFFIALRKDIKNLTEDQRKRPFLFIWELLPIIGLSGLCRFSFTVLPSSRKFFKCPNVTYSF